MLDSGSGRGKLTKTGSAATRRIRTFRLLLLPGNTVPIDPGLQRVVKRLTTSVTRRRRYALNLDSAGLAAPVHATGGQYWCYVSYKLYAIKWRKIETSFGDEFLVKPKTLGDVDDRATE